MMKFLITNIPDDGWVSIFGMEAGQETVNGDPTHTYSSIEEPSGVHVFEISPKSPRVLVRAGGLTWRWRADKEQLSKTTDTYNPELMLEYEDKTIEFDWLDYMEHDSVSDEVPKVEPLITVIDHTSFKNLDDSQKRPFQYHFNPELDVSDQSKNMYFSFDRSHIKEIDHFRHRMPREVSWLLYGSLPAGGSRMESVFFGYEFGPDHGIDPKTLERQPWRLEPKWNVVSQKFKKELEDMLTSWGEKALHLTTREFVVVAPRFVASDNTFQLRNVYGGGDPTLWHYFSAPKFLDFVRTKQMWFSRSSGFSDPFESKTNQATRAYQVQTAVRKIVDEYNIAIHEKDEAFTQSCKVWAKHLNRNELGLITKTEMQSFSDVPVELLALAENRLDAINDSLLINCWHENPIESDAMWGLYSDRRFGVAITSSAEKIRSAFSGSGVNLNITPIEYHNLHTSEAVFDSLPVAYKHEAFKHEKEYRAYVSGYALPSSKPGISVSFDPVELIDKIVVSPECPSWFKESIQWAVDCAELEISVENSIFTLELY